MILDNMKYKVTISTEMYEGLYLSHYFMKNIVGIEYLRQKQICSIYKNESPDFIGLTSDGRKIGMEVTNIILGENSIFLSNIVKIIQNVVELIQANLKNKYFITARYPTVIDYKKVKFNKKQISKKLFAEIKDYEVNNTIVNNLLGLIT